MFPLLFMFTMAPKLPAKLAVSYGPKVSGIIFVWFAMAPMFPFFYGPQVSSIVFRGPKVLNGPKVSGTVCMAHTFRRRLVFAMIWPLQRLLALCGVVSAPVCWRGDLA